MRTCSSGVICQSKLKVRRNSEGQPGHWAGPCISFACYYRRLWPLRERQGRQEVDTKQTRRCQRQQTFSSSVTGYCAMRWSRPFYSEVFQIDEGKTQKPSSWQWTLVVYSPYPARRTRNMASQNNRDDFPDSIFSIFVIPRNVVVGRKKSDYVDVGSQQCLPCPFLSILDLSAGTPSSAAFHLPGNCWQNLPPGYIDFRVGLKNRGVGPLSVPCRTVLPHARQCHYMNISMDILGS